jgi:hypothetical protein
MLWHLKSSLRLKGSGGSDTGNPRDGMLEDYLRRAATTSILRQYCKHKINRV